MPINAQSASVFVLVLSAGGIVMFAGCDTKQAGATSSIAPTVSSHEASPNPSADNKSVGTPRPKLRPGARTVVLARAGDRPYDKTFDDFRFDMTPGKEFKRSMLTKDIEALNGQRIRIRGYILPTPQKHGIQQFVLVRDNQECCFGPGAALYDCILIEMKPGNTADFTIRPIAVEGTFNVHEVVVDGKHLAIYQMDAESARPN
jgi:hypothetical protein